MVTVEVNAPQAHHISPADAQRRIEALEERVATLEAALTELGLVMPAQSKLRVAYETGVQDGFRLALPDQTGLD